MVTGSRVSQGAAWVMGGENESVRAQGGARLLMFAQLVRGWSSASYRKAYSGNFDCLKITWGEGRGREAVLERWLQG